MNKEALIAGLERPMNSQMVFNMTSIIESSDLSIDEVIDITFHKKKEVAFRASWMLEYFMVHKPVAFSEHIGNLLLLLPKQKNPSAMRHYAKIVSLLTAKRHDPVYDDVLQSLDFEPVIESLFIWLVDEEVLVATKVHCMQALANLAPKFDWIKSELLQTVDHLVAIESYAFFARAKMVRKQLGKL